MTSRDDLDVAAAAGPLDSRLSQGLAKLAMALHHEQRAVSARHGLSPTQAQIVVTVAAGSARLGDIAHRLGLGAATVSESVSAAETKGLVVRKPDPSDARAILVDATDAGRSVAAELSGWPDFMTEALDLLTDDEQGQLLATTVRLIGRLQKEGRIPVARMCTTCVHFRPNVHDDVTAPHHCAFVNVAFGDREVRVDCRDHVPLTV